MLAARTFYFMRVAALCLLLTTFRATASEPVHPYVSYDFFEVRRTDSDHRECITQIGLMANDYVNYYYREDVFGSTTPTVKSIKFSSGTSRQATKDEQTELVNELLAANVFELASDPQRPDPDYYSYLDVRIGAQDKHFYFASPPQSPARKAIHDILLRFAARMKVDHPEDLANATTTTEGDRQPAQAVKLSDLLAHPDEYHGKRVSVVGFHHEETESNKLAVDRVAAETLNCKQSIEQDEPSTFADATALHGRNDSWLRVEGVFLRGPSGQIGISCHEITRLTRVEPVPEPK